MAASRRENPFIMYMQDGAFKPFSDLAITEVRANGITPTKSFPWTLFRVNTS